MFSLTKTILKSQLFFPGKRKNGEYLFDRSLVFSHPSGKDFSFPINIDTEFLSLPSHWTTKKIQGREGITTQMRGLNVSEGLIFSHEDFAKPRHQKVSSGFHPVDYLVAIGHDAKLTRVDIVDESLPVIEFVLYAHFALAEIGLIADRQFKNDILALLKVTDKENKPRLTMNRRLRAVSPKQFGDDDRVELPWVLYLDGFEYRVKLSIMDTGALHGIASYADVCEAAGIKLEHKTDLNQEDKERMDETYLNKPSAFDEYSLGDLFPYDVLEKNADNYKKIYNDLGLIKFYKAPKLTIGATVKDLFEAALQNHTGLDDKSFKQLKDLFLEPVSAQELKKKSSETSALLAKVEGGRCRNNRPLADYIVSPMADLDISGCYGEGQRNQIYPIGKPEILSFDTKSKVNRYWTLREFLKAYGAGDSPKSWEENKGDLYPGAWVARATATDLKYRQDYLASWFVDTGSGEDLMAKYVKTSEADTEKEAKDFNVEDGNLKIFNHEILNAVITHDYIDWLMFIASDRQRKELLDGLLVKAAIVYPASKLCLSIDDFLSSHENHKGQNKVSRKGSKLRKEDGECHAWYGINLGDLLINDLIANRKLYDKKTPLDKLFKLCINTLYGDMTSKFFESANVVVGNNITARARAMAWYMEKGLYGFETVTDGCVFELNKVVLEIESSLGLVNHYREDLTGKTHIKKGSIEGDAIILNWISLEIKGKKSYYPEIVFGDISLTPKIVSVDGKEKVEVPAIAWINKKAIEHLQNIFPKVAVLHTPSTSLKPFQTEEGKAAYNLIPRIGQFEFEVKDFYDSAVFHGTSNYCLKNPNDINLKMRAYEAKKPHESLKDGKPTDRYDRKNNPATDFLRGLENPQAIKRQSVFVKTAMLKVSDYKNRLKTWESLGLIPGDSFYKSGLLREFSISQFTFQTFAQYRSWMKAVEFRKDKYQQSIESLFINSDGTLDFRSMINAVDKAIADGVTNPFEELSTYNKVAIEKHPDSEDLLYIRNLLKTPSDFES